VVGSAREHATGQVGVGHCALRCGRLAAEAAVVQEHIHALQLLLVEQNRSAAMRRKVAKQEPCRHGAGCDSHERWVWVEVQHRACGCLLCVIMVCLANSRCITRSAWEDLMQWGNVCEGMIARAWRSGFRRGREQQRH
jgi:hypothetical protein